MKEKVFHHWMDRHQREEQLLETTAGLRGSWLVSVYGSFCTGGHGFELDWYQTAVRRVFVKQTGLNRSEPVNPGGTG